MQRLTIAQLHEYRYASLAFHGQQDGAVRRRPPQRVDRLLQCSCGDRPIATHVQHADFVPTRDRQQRQRGVTDHALHFEPKGAGHGVLGANELFAPTRSCTDTSRARNLWCQVVQDVELISRLKSDTPKKTRSPFTQFMAIHAGSDPGSPGS
jgi:hypothetical protein